jgi:hypothetical protein
VYVLLYSGYFLLVNFPACAIRLVFAFKISVLVSFSRLLLACDATASCSISSHLISCLSALLDSTFALAGVSGAAWTSHVLFVHLYLSQHSVFVFSVVASGLRGDSVGSRRNVSGRKFSVGTCALMFGCDIDFDFFNVFLYHWTHAKFFLFMS